MGTPEEGQALELVIEAKTDRYDPTDDRWRGQVSQLHTSLREEVGGVRRERSAVPGTKGVVETVILALGSAGAFTAAVECFRAWLRRDRTRSLEISWWGDGRQERVVIRGDAIDSAALHAVAEAMSRRLGESSWPRAATEPS